MQRLIVTSATYRQASARPAAGVHRDVENRLYARQKLAAAERRAVVRRALGCVGPRQRQDERPAGCGPNCRSRCCKPIRRFSTTTRRSPRGGIRRRPKSRTPGAYSSCRSERCGFRFWNCLICPRISPVAGGGTQSNRRATGLHAAQLRRSPVRAAQVVRRAGESQAGDDPRRQIESWPSLRALQRDAKF